jgi:hypothetical protein
MGLLEQTIKPKGICRLEGCNKKVKNKRRVFCSRECHEKSIGAKIPKCGNPACDNRVKRGRNQYCSWECYKVHNDVHAHETCQRQGCNEHLTSRKSTRKYCSQECYRLDHPNRPSRKKVRICTLPGCGKQIHRRGNGRKFCSVECSVKARKKLTPLCCPSCDTEFSPKRFRQIYCSDKCRKNKKEFTIKKIGGHLRRYARVDGKWKLASNVTWKQNTGNDVPEKMNVWFKDNEPLNDLDFNNLYLIEHKEYLALCRKKLQNPVEEEFESGNFTGRSEEPEKKKSKKNKESVTF